MGATLPEIDYIFGLQGLHSSLIPAQVSRLSLLELPMRHLLKEGTLGQRRSTDKIISSCTGVKKSKERITLLVKPIL